MDRTLADAELDPDRDAGSRAVPELVFLGLGSNLGHRVQALGRAASRLALCPAVSVLRVSGVYETDPWGVTDQPPFLNLVIAARVSLAPIALLQWLKALERNLGREPEGERWGPRAIDLDILAWGTRKHNSPTLTLPHPRNRERQFVLVPWAEIAPWAEAAPGVRVRDVARPGHPAVRRLGPLGALLRARPG